MHRQQMAAVVIQKYSRSYLARKTLARLRKEAKERKIMNMIKNVE